MVSFSQLAKIQVGKNVVVFIFIYFYRKEEVRFGGSHVNYRPYNVLHRGILAVNKKSFTKNPTLPRVLLLKLCKPTSVDAFK